MDNQTFSTIVKQACQEQSLPTALTFLTQVDDLEIAEAAQALVGQFMLAEVEGEKRIYHVFTELNEAGEETEYMEHVMNEGDETLIFVAWFFESEFDVKRKELYAAAGRTYQQPKRRS